MTATAIPIPDLLPTSYAAAHQRTLVALAVLTAAVRHSLEVAGTPRYPGARLDRDAALRIYRAEAAHLERLAELMRSRTA
jgi:hypothetical protein